MTTNKHTLPDLETIRAALLTYAPTYAARYASAIEETKRRHTAAAAALAKAAAYARAAEADYRAAKTTTADLAADVTTPADVLTAARADRRAALAEAKRAREYERTAADDLAEEAAALAALTTTADRLTDEAAAALVVVWRERTAADDLAAEAKSAYTAARMAYEAAEAMAAGMTRRDRAECLTPHADRLRAARSAHAAARREAARAAVSAPRVMWRVGVDMAADRPTAAIRAAYEVSAAVADLVGASDLGSANVYIDYISKPELTLAAARTIAKAAADAATRRQGTPDQWRIADAARAGHWDMPDLADLVGEAAAALAMVTASDEAADDLTEEADRLDDLARRLNMVSRGDSVARAVILRTAHETAPTAAAARMVSTSDTDRRRAADYRMALAARAAYAVGNLACAYDLATLAAHHRISGYLTDNRAIRDDATAPVLSLEAMAEACTDPRTVAHDDGAATEWRVRRAVNVYRAYTVAAPMLTPRQRTVLSALWRDGGDVAAVARHLGISESTARNHRDAIARTMAAAAAKTAPESIEAAAMMEAVRLDTVAAAAAMQARAAAAARREADHARHEAAAALAARADLRADLAAAYADAVAALTPAMRDTVGLLTSGRSQREAAAALGRSRATVREAARAAARRIGDALAARLTTDTDRATVAALVSRADLDGLAALASRVG